MKFFWISLVVITGCLFLVGEPAFALDSAQKKVMNKAITGQLGTAGITSATSSTTTTYTDSVKAVRLAITSVIAGFYFLFVAWLIKSQYIAWAEGDIDSGEGFGSTVIASLLLLLIVFILTT